MREQMKHGEPASGLICDAAFEVLAAADHLTNEYTRHDKGHGTGVGMRASEDRLMSAVFRWRSQCGAKTQTHGMTSEGLKLLRSATEPKASDPNA